MDDQQFDAFLATLTGLLTEVVALNTRQVTINDRQVTINDQQVLTNHRLELLILEMLRQRQGDTPH